MTMKPAPRLDRSRTRAALTAVQARPARSDRHAAELPKPTGHSEIRITRLDGTVVTGEGENLAQAVAAAGRQAEEEREYLLTEAGWQLVYRMLRAAGK